MSAREPEVQPSEPKQIKVKFSLKRPRASAEASRAQPPQSPEMDMEEDLEPGEINARMLAEINSGIMDALGDEENEQQEAKRVAGMNDGGVEEEEEDDEEEGEDDEIEEYIEMKPGGCPMFEYSCNLCQLTARTRSGRFYHKIRQPRNYYYPCDTCTFVEQTLDELSQQDSSRLTVTRSRGPDSVLGAPATTARSSSTSSSSSSTHPVNLPNIPGLNITPVSDKADIQDTSSGSTEPDTRKVISVHPCMECDYLAISLPSLKNHMKTKHEKSASSSRASSPSLETALALFDSFQSPNELNCPECDYTTDDSGALRCHVVNQHELVRFPCDLCDFFATRKSTLKTHILSIHEGVKYPCELCKYAATQKSALKRHMRTVHNPERLCRRMRNYDYKSSSGGLVTMGSSMLKQNSAPLGLTYILPKPV